MTETKADLRGGTCCWGRSGPRGFISLYNIMYTYKCIWGFIKNPAFQSHLRIREDFDSIR